MKVKRLHINPRLIIEYVMIFMIVISSASMWIQEGINIVDIQLLRILIFGLAIVWLFFFAKKISKKDIKLFLMVIICLLAYIPFHLNSLYAFFVIIFFPILFFGLIAYCAAANGILNELLNSFVNIMLVIASSSLVFYFLINVCNILKPTGYYSIEWSWISRIPSYYHLYYVPMPKGLQGYSIMRNCAIFTEAPMYSYLLCFALAINELLLGGKRKIVTIILTITIITTISSTGFLILVVIYAYLFISNPKNKGFLKIFFLLGGTGIAIYLIFSILIQKSETGSYSVRMDHLYGSLKCFADTLGIGVGIGNDDGVAQYFTYKQGNSTGIPYLLAQGGIFWGLAYFIPMIFYCVRSFRVKKYSNICFAVVFFILLFMTACQSRYSTWFIFSLTFMLGVYPDRLNKRSD